MLVTTLGGTTLAWTSPQLLALGAAGLLSLAAFLLVERRAAEPILPPRLWRNRTFRVTSAVGLIIGFSLFGAVTFLPLFQQVVRGQSPTESGLQLVPLMGGLMISSVVSGRLIAHTGRYRVYPIAGTALTVVGLLLLSLMGPATPTIEAAAFMAVLGLGLGMVMQVLILAVQNDAPYEDLGVATAGATLFRSIGGSLGTATWAPSSPTASSPSWPTGSRPVPAPGSAREASTPRRWPRCPRRSTRPIWPGSRAPSRRSSSWPPSSRCSPSPSRG